MATRAQGPSLRLPVPTASTNKNSPRLIRKERRTKKCWGPEDTDSQLTINSFGLFFKTESALKASNLSNNSFHIWLKIGFLSEPLLYNEYRLPARTIANLISFGKFLGHLGQNLIQFGPRPPILQRTTDERSVILAIQRVVSVSWMQNLLEF